MYKIETPEEFAKRHYDAIATMSVNGVLYLRDLTKARDALIRADERRKAAERAVVWTKENILFEPTEEWLKVRREKQCDSLRAAIMAEPEEGV